MYKDGFDAKRINCIQGPMAAAAGYYDRNYYFYYCYLYSLFNLFGHDKYSFFEFSNRILNIMGLSLNYIDYGSDYDEALITIKEIIDKGSPVLVFCKYNALFYSSYYDNSNFKLVHGLIVSGYNDGNKTIVINESTLLRNVFSKSNNPDVYFPLQIKETSMKEILMKSNPQFGDIEFGTENFANKVFYVKKEKNVILQMCDIINKSREIISQRIYESDFIINLKKYYIDSQVKINFTFEDYFSKYVWGLDAIFKLFYMYTNENELHREKIKMLEKEIVDSKKNTISKFIKTVMKKEKLTDKLKASMIDSWEYSNELLMTIITELSKNIPSKMYEYFPIKINDHYNCQAFEESINNNSTADITGEGTHFLFENIVTDKLWQNNDYAFIYNYLKNQNDNISCQGQSIDIDVKKIFSGIAILGCSEYGSYREKIIVTYINGKNYEFEADFSDFFQAAIYEEKLFWKGIALDRKRGKTTVHNFSARLFAKRYEIPRGRIISVHLPKRKNIHIFAITFENLT